jgi:hypothetical protein
VGVEETAGMDVGAVGGVAMAKVNLCPVDAVIPAGPQADNTVERKINRQLAITRVLPK